MGSGDFDELLAHQAKPYEHASVNPCEVYCMCDLVQPANLEFNIFPQPFVGNVNMADFGSAMISLPISMDVGKHEHSGSSVSQSETAMVSQRTLNQF